MNSKAIADALAARFVGVTANGATLAIGPTASLPNLITKGPALLVYHPTGVLDVGMSKLRNDELDFPVRLLIDPFDVPTRSDALYAWYDALRDVVEAHGTLGLSNVAWSRPVNVRIELDGETYAGALFDVVEFTVRVHFFETVPTVAA